MITLKTCLGSLCIVFLVFVLLTLAGVFNSHTPVVTQSPGANLHAIVDGSHVPVISGPNGPITVGFEKGPTEAMGVSLTFHASTAYSMDIIDGYGNKRQCDYWINYLGNREFNYHDCKEYK